MQIHALTFSETVCNTYVLDDENGHAVLVDPGYGERDAIVTFLEKHKLELDAILITHGHYDHIRGLSSLIAHFPKAAVYMHIKEIPFLSDPRLNCSYMDSKIEPVAIDAQPIPVEDGDVLHLLGQKVNVVHTPFHTHGSVCYYLPEERLVFTGDTLFMNSIGRSDLLTSSPRTIIASLAKIKSLPSETRVYPGHGKATTIEREMRFNTFLRKEYIPNGR